MPHELTWERNYLELSSSLILPNKKPFPHHLVIWRRVDSTWQLARQWLDQEADPEYNPKPNLHSKKTVVTVWWSVANQIHHSFLNPKKQLHLRSVLRKLTRYNKNCSPYHCLVLYDNIPAYDTILHTLNELDYEVLIHLLQPPALSLTGKTSSSI